MRRGAVPVLCLVQFVDVLGVTSAVTAVPSIVRGIGAGPAAAGPVVTTYAMFFGGLLILGARLGDRYGHRRVLVAGVIAFAVVAVLGGTATALPQLLAARALQGAAAAISSPSALRLLLHVSEEGAARTRALAAWSAVGAVAGATGFLLGGFLTQALGWQAVFWVNAPVSILLLIGILGLVRVRPTERVRTPLDLPGAMLLVAAVMPLIAGAALAESPSGRPTGIALVALGVLFALAFAWRMRVARMPLLPAAAVRSTNLRRGTVESFVNTASTSSSAVLVTVFLQDALGLTALEAGLTLMSFSVAVVLGASGVGPLARRLDGDRLAGVGLLAIALGDTAFAVTGTWWGVVVGLVLGGIGIGVASVAATSTGTTVDATLTGIATGVLNTGAQLGTALGTAAVVLVASLTGPAIGWGVAAAGALGTAAWCFLRATAERDRGAEATAA